MKHESSMIVEGVVGTIASITLAIPMYHEEIEFILRIMSGICSVSAGVFTMIAMYKKIKKYNGNNNI